jgi:hypothetical protein
MRKSRQNFVRIMNKKDKAFLKQSKGKSILCPIQSKMAQFALSEIPIRIIGITDS